jgi:phosphoribosylformylglycinamidine cyclo-ligase
MMDYKSAGVDIEAGYRSVELMKAYVAKTMRPEVMGGLGGFSGAFSLAKIKEMDEPILLSGTDGVGTKLKLAFLMDRHDTVGIDCVAMCVNDVACAGGEPLFFLDYIACGKNVPEKIAQIVKGVCDGCEQAGAALIGGETAEMPGFYPVDEYDLAGFAVGAADKKNLITGQDILAQLKDKDLGEALLMPQNILRSQETVLLDDVTVEDLVLTLQVPVNIVKSSGYDFVSTILKEV